MAPTYAYLAVVSITLIVIDIRHKLLPNALTLTSYPIVLSLLTIPATVEDDWRSWGRALTASLVVVVLFAAMAIFASGSFGMGDAKLGAVLALPLGWQSWTHVPGGWAWTSIPILAMVGFWLPDLLAYNAGLRRTEAIRRSLPDAIELLSLCVQSGMGFQAALRQVADYQEGPIAQEFARVLREMQLGQSRQVALEALARRNRDEDLHRFVSAIVQADRLGVAISGVLTEQAAELRSKRRDRARESAQKVPVKILLPVIACFLPGIFIIVLGPATLSLFRMFSSV